MKKLILVAGIATLAACSGGADEAEAPAAEAVEAAPLAITAADGGPSSGTYIVTGADGESSTEVLAVDGTFTSTDAEGEVTTGTYEQKSPNEFCAKEDSDEEMTCYAEEVNEEGVWTSTDPDDGEVSTVERVAETAAEDAETTEG